MNKSLVILCLLAIVSISISSQEDLSLDKVKNSGILKIGMNTTELPWALYDKKTKNLIGYEVEIQKLIAEKLTQWLGKKIQIKVVNGKWLDLPKLLNKGKFDVIGNAYGPYKYDNVVWSKAYHKWGLMLAVRKNSSYSSPNALQNKLVAHYNEFIARKTAKELGLNKLKAYEDGEAALKNLVNGKVEGFMYDSVFLQYYAKKDSRVKIIGGLLHHSGYHFGVRKQDSALLAMLDKAVTEVLKSDQYKKILQKWFGKN